MQRDLDLIKTILMELEVGRVFNAQKLKSRKKVVGRVFNVQKLKSRKKVVGRVFNVTLQQPNPTWHVKNVPYVKLHYFSGSLALKKYLKNTKKQELKGIKKIQITLNQDVSDYLTNLAKTTGQTPTELIEKAIFKTYPLREVPKLDRQTIELFKNLETSSNFSDEAIIQRYGLEKL